MSTAHGPSGPGILLFCQSRRLLALADHTGCPRLALPRPQGWSSPALHRHLVQGPRSHGQSPLLLPSLRPTHRPHPLDCGRTQGSQAKLPEKSFIQTNFWTRLLPTVPRKSRVEGLPWEGAGVGRPGGHGVGLGEAGRGLTHPTSMAAPHPPGSLEPSRNRPPSPACSARPPRRPVLPFPAQSLLP